MRDLQRPTCLSSSRSGLGHMPVGEMEKEKVVSGRACNTIGLAATLWLKAMNFQGCHS